jgi:hypothetical protein
LYLNETQTQWERCLHDNRFHAEFGQYDARLRSALDQFLALMHDLTAEAETLTLINADLHPGHIRLLKDDRPVFIDWQQACYGSFYLDLVNYFSIETAYYTGMLWQTQVTLFHPQISWIAFERLDATWGCAISK